MSLDYLQKLQLDTQLADGQARFDVINPEKSFIVQAPAGSGKTALLTQRYLALLVLVDSPEKVVAMTFTKKAASEMQLRILEALQKANHVSEADIQKENLYEQNTWWLAQAVLEVNNRQGWGLLDNPNRLRIKTIDSFNSYLVQQMPLLSRFGSQPSVAQSGIALYEQAAREVLADPTVFKQVAYLMNLVNGHRATAENIIVEMLAKRDQWLPLLKTQIHSSDEQLNSSLQNLVLVEFTSLIAVMAPLLPSLEMARTILLEVLTDDEEAIAALTRLKLSHKRSDDFTLEDIAGLRMLSQKILTKKGTPLKSVGPKAGFLGKTKAEKAQKALFKETLEGMATIDFKGNLCQALLQISALPHFEYRAEQLESIDNILTLLKMASAYLKMVFTREGESDFIEIAQAASEALGESDEPTELAQRLDYQIEHLLVDEFQDTSVSQYELLKKLVGGWSVEDNHTLFIVGDPMQSIYRFREAEVANFLDAWSGSIEQFPLNRVNLTVNFRSTLGIVNWVNQAFQKIMPTENKIDKGAVCYTLSDAFSTLDNDAVQLNWTVNEPKEAQLQKVVDDIEAVLASKKPGENIGVLARTKTVLIPIAKALKQRKIAFKAIEIETLDKQQEIQDLESLTKAFMHLADRGAWIALLRTPAIGLNLHDLSALLEPSWPDVSLLETETFVESLADSKALSNSAIKHWSVWSILSFYAKENFETAKLSAEGVQKLNRAYPILQNALSKIGRLKWSRLIPETWLVLDMAQGLDDEASLQNIDAFWQMLSSLESSKEGLTLAGLSSQVTKLFALPADSEDSGQIELMTMHKSKGLEFDTVFLPELNKQPRSDTAALFSWLHFQTQGQQQLVFAPMVQKGQNDIQLENKALVDFLQGFEKEKQQFELARLFYVACSRAKQSLKLYANVDISESSYQKDEPLKPIKNALLSCFWSDQQAAFDQQANALVFDEVETSDSVPTLLVRRIPVNRQSLFPAQSSNENTLQKNMNIQEMSEPLQDREQTENTVQDTAQEISQALMATEAGNLVHEFLEVWGLHGLPNRLLPGHKDYIQSRLKQAGLTDAILAEAERRVITSLSHALQQPKIRWALSSEQQAASCELPLTSQGMLFEGSKIEDDQQSHIIDRTFVDADNTRWIVDYKTSFWHSEMAMSEEKFIAEQVKTYRPQLARYGALMATLESRPQKWVLYFSYLDKWVEVV